jgi:penicillin-binding protein 2
VARLVTNREVVAHLVRRSGAIAAGRQFDPDEGASDFASLGFSSHNLANVLRGMDAVCNEIGGTAYGARITDEGMAMGGKSGTAQVRHITQAEREHGLRKPDQIPWKDRDHALFVAFAPVQAPRYVCAVVVEHGIGGSKYAAPIARDVLRECQRRDPARRYPPEPAIVAEAGAAPQMPSP